MAYITTIEPEQADDRLAALYRRFANPDCTVDNVLKAHSVNPDALDAHCRLYVQAMHRPSPLTRVEREILAVTVSRINACHY